MSQTRSFANLYAIVNQDELTADYRLLAIRNLQNDSREKNLSLLQTRVTYELKQPVALVTRDDMPYLAIPASSPLPKREHQLTPHVVELEPSIETHLLNFGSLTSENTDI